MRYECVAATLGIIRYPLIAEPLKVPYEVSALPDFPVDLIAITAYLGTDLELCSAFDNNGTFYNVDAGIAGFNIPRPSDTRRRCTLPLCLA